MKISQVIIKNFRNFKEAVINLNPQTLVIGQNDIGKTNLLLALRTLFDPTLSFNDLVPLETDFHVGSQTDRIEIIVRIDEAEEDCIKAVLGKYMNDQGSVFLIYEGYRNPLDGDDPFQVFASHELNTDSYQPISRSTYLRVLKIKYIDSNRNLFDYIKKEKRALLQKARDLRKEEAVTEDDKNYEKIVSGLEEVNNAIRKLSYVLNATNILNEELDKLSHHHHGQNVVFDVGDSDPEKFVEDVRLAAEIENNAIAIGGEGRNNQIFFALWATQNEIQNKFENEVNIYCIEEPEAHLHPHQQRKLASYFVNNANSQLIITSHSPQIAAEFSPNSIVRLFNQSGETKAANDGCGDHVEEAFVKFAHRMSILPAEAFFSNVVLLVEGVSELLFYKALGLQIGVDLDQFNISVLSVEGIGFMPFTDLLNALNIEWVIRTDNDLIQKGGKVKKGEKRMYYARGVSIGIDQYKTYWEKIPPLEKLIKDHADLLKNLPSGEPELETQKIIGLIRDELKKTAFFLASQDLESDLLYSPLGPKIKEYWRHLNSDDKILEAMRDAKGENMFSFLMKNSDSLRVLINDDLAKPLLRCKKIVESIWQRNNPPQSSSK
ncbi:MAG: AAA family ATPase [Bacteroidia bacterium]|nr:AAA family ATPase [Bacteroidia bacterium]